jgi:hypothetical protein
MTSQELLAKVRAYFPDRAHAVGEHLAKELGLYILDGGKAVYLIASDLDLDSDGSVGLNGDAFHQAQTSLRYNDAAKTSIDANKVPFFVLPGHWNHGVELGDFGVIFTESHFSYFICGDRGPKSKISEGSLEMHRRLGKERVFHNHVVDVGLGEHVRVVLFPGSGNGHCVSVHEIETKAAALVAAL